MHFPTSKLDDWKGGDYKMLEASLASEYLKRVLPAKARTKRKARIAAGKKPTGWFFGEAYVATHVPHEAGWYSSFKWLTSGLWGEKRGPNDERHLQFSDALKTHLGDLTDLQESARELLKLATKKPVAPDLWLFADGVHRFIEVKIPPDPIARHQLAGLAVLASCIPSHVPVSVEIIRLYSEESGTPRSSFGDEETFEEFCREIKRRRS
jgi:hypothetical protein